MLQINSCTVLRGDVQTQSRKQQWQTRRKWDTLRHSQRNNKKRLRKRVEMERRGKQSKLFVEDKAARATACITSISVCVCASHQVRQPGWREHCTGSEPAQLQYTSHWSPATSHHRSSATGRKKHFGGFIRIQLSLKTVFRASSVETYATCLSLQYSVDTLRSS